MKNLVILIALVFSFFSHASQPSVQLVPLEDLELVEYLLDKAERLSGLATQRRDLIPPIYAISKADMSKTVCPEDPGNCRNLAAVFDDLGYRILYLDDFEISQNFKPYDYSFLIHELIHWLQYMNYGAEIFNGCDKIYETEFFAYQAQDKYLAEEGAFERVGNFFRFSFACDEEIAQKEYAESKQVWDQRQTP